MTNKDDVLSADELAWEFFCECINGDGSIFYKDKAIELIKARDKALLMKANEDKQKLIECIRTYADGDNWVLKNRWVGLSYGAYKAEQTLKEVGSYE